ncbi:hypothetical protein [Aeromonas phage AerS_266]|nr:hypothetical protein [Aeromonas phage AerS_266]
MEGSRYEYEIQGDKIILFDKENEGALTIRFSPPDKKSGGLLMDSVICDIMTDIYKKKLDLILKGHSVIKVRHELALIGKVELRSCHLSDTVIENSVLTYVSMVPYTEFRNSQIGYVGKTDIGKVVFQHCDIKSQSGFKFPNQPITVFNNNCLV